MHVVKVIGVYCVSEEAFKHMDLPHNAEEGRIDWEESKACGCPKLGKLLLG